MRVEFDPELQVVGDPNTKTCIAGTSDGRIFMTGWDGSLAEVCYSSDREHSENPLTIFGMAKRTRTVLHTASLSWVVPTWVTTMAGGVIPEPLESVVVDHWRSRLYTLSRDGTITAYTLAPGAEPSRVASLSDAGSSSSSFTSSARRACADGDPLRGGTSGSVDVVASFTPVSLHVVDPLHGGTDVELVAVTATGARAFIYRAKTRLFVRAFVSAPARPALATMDPAGPSAGAAPSRSRVVASYCSDGVFLVARRSTETAAAALGAAAAAAGRAAGRAPADTEVTASTVSPWRLREASLARLAAEAGVGRAGAAPVGGAFAAFGETADASDAAALFEQVEPLDVAASGGLTGSAVAIGEEPRPPTLLRSREFVPSGCTALGAVFGATQVAPLPVLGAADNLLHAEAAHGASRMGISATNGSTGLEIDRYAVASFPVVPFPASVDVLTRAKRSELDSSVKPASRSRSYGRGWDDAGKEAAPDSRPLTELALQAETARGKRTFVVVSAAGVWLVTRLRAADVLRKAAREEPTGFLDAMGRPSLMDVRLLERRYGEIEAVAAFALINEEAEAESGSGYGAATTVANEGGIALSGAEPVMNKVRELARKHRRGARLADPDALGTGVSAERFIVFSTAFRGLCLHLHRILRPVWGQQLFASSHVPSPDVLNGKRYTSPTASQIFGMASGEGRFLVPRFEPIELETVASRLDSVRRFVDRVYDIHHGRVIQLTASNCEAAAREQRAEATMLEQRLAASLSSFCDLASQTLRAVGWLSRLSWNRHPDPAPLHTIVALSKTTSVVTMLRLRNVVLAHEEEGDGVLSAAASSSSSPAMSASARSPAFKCLVQLVRDKVKQLRLASQRHVSLHEEVDEDVRGLAALCPAFFSGSDERLDAAKKRLEPDQSDEGTLATQRRHAVEIVREALSSWDASKGTSLDDLEQVAGLLCKDKHNDVDAALSILIEAELSAARAAGVAVQGGGGGAAAAAAAAASSSSAGVRGIPAGRRLRGMLVHSGATSAAFASGMSSAASAAGAGYGAGTDDPAALEALLDRIEARERADGVDWTSSHKRRLSSASKLADSPALLAQWTRLECARVMLRWFINLSDDKLRAWAMEARQARFQLHPTSTLDSVPDAVNTLLRRVIELGPSNLLVLVLCRFAANFAADPSDDGAGSIRAIGDSSASSLIGWSSSSSAAAAALASEAMAVTSGGAMTTLTGQHRTVTELESIRRRVEALEQALWASDHGAVTVFLHSHRHDIGSKRRFGMYIDHLVQRGDKSAAAQEHASRALTGRSARGAGPTLEERRDCLQHAIKLAATAQPPLQEAVVTTWRSKLRLVQVQQSLHRLARARVASDPSIRRLLEGLEFNPPESHMLLESAHRLDAFHASMSVHCLQQGDSAAAIHHTFAAFVRRRAGAVRGRVSSDEPDRAADEWFATAMAMVVPAAEGSPDEPDSVDVSQTAALLLHPDSPARLSVTALVRDLEGIAFLASEAISDSELLKREELWGVVSVGILGAVHTTLAKQLAGRPTRLSLPSRLAAYMSELGDHARAELPVRLHFIRSSVSLLSHWIQGSRSQQGRADSAHNHAERIREAVDRMMAMLNSGAAEAEAAVDDAGLGGESFDTMTGALKERLRVITGEVERMQARFVHEL